jgi:putative methyltransferase (TIGR04325 family)
MSTRARLDRTIAAAKELPVVSTLMRRRYERAFRSADGLNLWYGVYRSFAAAAAAAPTRVPLGYDQATTVDLYDAEQFQRVGPQDYPVLYWLLRECGPSSRLFDFGGHVGVSYYAYRPYLAPDHMPDWTVCDVPAVVRGGAARAEARGASSLHFTTEFANADGRDVLLISGALQYIETPLAQMLSALAQRPRYVILNKLPTSDRELITLQNIGVAYCPYRIAARQGLPTLLAAVGYEHVDEWEIPGERRTKLPYSNTGPVTWVGACYRLR